MFQKIAVGELGPFRAGARAQLQSRRRVRSRSGPRKKFVDFENANQLCGCKGWDEMAEFAEAGEEQLRSILELPHGIPCADTLRRTLAALQIAVDGKTVRGSEAVGNVSFTVIPLPKPKEERSALRASLNLPDPVLRRRAARIARCRDLRWTLWSTPFEVWAKGLDPPARLNS